MGAGVCPEGSGESFAPTVALTTMAIANLTMERFAATVRQQGTVFIDFWAGWCAPCRAFAPIFEAAAERHPDVTWCKVDTETEQTIASALNVSSIPTLMIFRDGLLLFNQPGMLPAEALDELVKRVQQLDMRALGAAAATSASGR